MHIAELRAKIKIRSEVSQWWHAVLWRVWLRTQITIAWPRGWTPQDHLGNSAESSDPNEWYREWLEQHVGRQGWAWDWRIGEYTYEGTRDTLLVKFRDPKKASWFALVWG